MAKKRINVQDEAVNIARTWLEKIDPLKASAFVGSTYLLYSLIGNKKIINAYEDIQLFGSPALFTLKYLGWFDPFRAKEEILDIRFGELEKLGISLIGAWLLVEHGEDLLGLLKKVPLMVT